VKRPGHDDGPAVDQAIRYFTGFLPYVVGKRAAAPDGSSVVIEIVGHDAIGIDVVDGRARMGALPDSPDVTVRTDAVTFAALVNGRVDAANADVEIVGDQALGQAIVENLNVMV
jgi:hypothetical protein